MRRGLGPIDVRALDCDFLACSAYKFFGPHVGALYGKAEHLEKLRPYKVRPADDCIPDRWETGTQNHEGLAGAIAAIDYLAELGRRHGEDGKTVGRRAELVHAMSAIREYERGLIGRLVEGLLAVDGLEFFGIREVERFDRRAPTVSIRLKGATPKELAAYLGEQGIFVWDGNYYALSLSQRLGVEDSGGMVRIGMAHYNTANEVDRLLGAIGGYPSR
jgi:selenocysteine lyase/cysteine desulfurase